MGWYAFHDIDLQDYLVHKLGDSPNVELIKAIEPHKDDVFELAEEFFQNECYCDPDFMRLRDRCLDEAFGEIRFELSSENETWPL